MRTPLPSLLAGILFGAGLALSDMINPARVLAFLDLAGAWDPTLAFVMAGAVLFGIGWGLVGFCPGPAIADLALDQWQPWVFVIAMLAGMAVHRFTAAGRASSPAPKVQADA